MLDSNNFFDGPSTKVIVCSIENTIDIGSPCILSEQLRRVRLSPSFLSHFFRKNEEAFFSHKKMEFELLTLQQEELLFKTHLSKLNQELKSLNVSFANGMPPVISRRGWPLPMESI
jgi:hypothetical protein